MFTALLTLLFYRFHGIETTWRRLPVHDLSVEQLIWTLIYVSGSFKVRICQFSDVTVFIVCQRWKRQTGSSEFGGTSLTQRDRECSLCPSILFVHARVQNTKRHERQRLWVLLDPETGRPRPQETRRGPAASSTHEQHDSDTEREGNSVWGSQPPSEEDHCLSRVRIKMAPTTTQRRTRVRPSWDGPEHNFTNSGQKAQRSK